MSDELIRKLQRRALAGDETARMEWQQALARAGQRSDLAWEGLGLVLSFDRARPYAEDTSGGAPTVLIAPATVATIDQDLTNLDGVKLLAGYPRDAKGQLKLKDPGVYLARYPDAEVPVEPGKKPRAAWLVARGPVRRSDPQVVRLTLVCTANKSPPQRWDVARWRWDVRAQQSDEARTLVDAIAGVLARDTLARLASRCRGGGGSLPERAALAVLLQDAGRPIEALALFGVGLTPAARKAYETGEGAGSLFGGDKGHARLKAALAEAAPWLFATSLAEHAPKRGVSAGQVHLVSLFGLNAAARCLTLRRAGDGLELDIVVTGTKDRVPEDGWKRPAELAEVPRAT